MNEFEKMSQGKLYDPNEPALAELRKHAHSLCYAYNKMDENECTPRTEIIQELLPHLGEGSFLQGPIFFDYGKNFKTGKNFYCNFNFTCLDVCPVIVGDNVFCGPNVSIEPPLHPLLPEERNPYMTPHGMTDQEYGAPIKIGNNCWIASNVTICAGAEIGDGCVIGAGSVVTGKSPDGYLAYGIPCRPIRKITEKDSVKLKKELY